MIPGLPNPWIILAIVLAFIANGFYWDRHGHSAEFLAWTAKEQKQKADNIQVARDKENADSARFAEIEGRYLNAQSNADDLARKLTAAMSGGVRLKGACNQAMPTTKEAAGSASPAASSDGILPQEIGRGLVDLAREAERVLGVAHAGQDTVGVK